MIQSPHDATTLLVLAWEFQEPTTSSGTRPTSTLLVQVRFLPRQNGHQHCLNAGSSTGIGGRTAPARSPSEILSPCPPDFELPHENVESSRHVTPTAHFVDLHPALDVCPVFNRITSRRFLAAISFPPPRRDRVELPLSELKPHQAQLLPSPCSCASDGRRNRALPERFANLL